MHKCVYIFITRHQNELKGKSMMKNSLTKMKRIVMSLILVAAMLCSALCVSSAQTVVNIGTMEELQSFAAQVNSGNSFAGVTVNLTADLILNSKLVDQDGKLNSGGHIVWTPAGTSSSPFKGTFNGNGHTVTGLYVNDEKAQYQGLFGVVSGATIYNVTVKDSYISADAHCGAIVGKADAKSIISSCHNDNSSIITKARSGGIVGWTNKSDVYNCSSNGYCYSKRCSGGIAGDVYSSSKIYNCYNGGVVDGNELVGGISGGTTSADIRNCINVGSVLYSKGYLIAGGAGSRTLTNCYALQNDEVNTGLSAGTSSKTLRTFATPKAVFDTEVSVNGKSYSTALAALNAWVDADTSDIHYSAWKQTSMYPFLAEGVISAVKTSYGSETSSWSNSDMEEAFNAGLVPEQLVGEDLTERITRAEFAAISVELYQTLTGKTNISTQGANAFQDISGSIYRDVILQASALDIAQGTSAVTYAPDSRINREQLATMLCRTVKKYKYDEWTYETDSDYYLDNSGVKKFADDSQISDWAKPSVYYMAKMGIVKGVDDTHFAPKNVTSAQEASGYALATREQAIVMSLRIYRLSDIL